MVNCWWLQVLVALACDLELDTLPCCAETHKWAWFRRYCMASRVAVALDRRAPLPRVFLDEVLRVALGKQRRVCSMAAQNSTRAVTRDVPLAGNYRNEQSTRVKTVQLPRNVSEGLSQWRWNDTAWPSPGGSGFTQSLLCHHRDVAEPMLPFPPILRWRSSCPLPPGGLLLL